MKRCRYCEHDLDPEKDFGVSKVRKDGRNIYCKKCNRFKTNASRQASREWRRLGMTRIPKPVARVAPPGLSSQVATGNSAAPVRARSRELRPVEVEVEAIN
jgi:SMC interacting uncharacterized protein involved in chromosome segregation